ncbi:MAG: hypothetical protein HIU87_15105 [Acidobacteria bacterium]|nr:hypothetical protein [Acidobacteriota bacterium]
MEVTTIKPFLEEFYGVAEAYVEGDDPATTFSSCGVVLLAAILAETSSVDILTKITGFPACFVEGVLRVMEIGGYHLSLQFADLITAACLHSDDFKTLENTLNDVIENYWARMDPIWCEAFETLRGGYLFGGRPQWWIDVEEGPQLLHEQWVN